jgi:hypothetical protein
VAIVNARETIMIKEHNFLWKWNLEQDSVYSTFCYFDLIYKRKRIMSLNICSVELVVHESVLPEHDEHYYEISVGCVDFKKHVDFLSEAHYNEKLLKKYRKVKHDKYINCVLFGSKEDAMIICEDVISKYLKQINKM